MSTDGRFVKGGIDNTGLHSKLYTSVDGNLAVPMDELYAARRIELCCGDVG